VLKRLVRFTLPVLVFALSAPIPGAAATSAALTSTPRSAAAPTVTVRQLDTVVSQIDVSVAAGAIASSGIAKSLKAKLNSARKAVAAMDTARANNMIEAFLSEVSAQRGHGIAASAADVLSDLASGSSLATVLSVPVGSATVIATQVSEVPLVLKLPAGTAVAWIRFGAAAGVSLPQPSGTRRLASIEVTAYDSFGRSVTQLGGSALISIGFQAESSVNTASARITTRSSAGVPETLATVVTGGTDAFTATASTTHLSPFVLDALTSVPPWRFTYVAPPKITAVTPATGNACGGTTVVVTGSGLSGVGQVVIDDIQAQSFTINSDTQITAVTSLPEIAVAEHVRVTTFLTSTALPAEFASTGFPLFLNQLELDARAGPNRPGTPTFTTAIVPAPPRITGVLTNQGPSIGAPVDPSQDFINPAIHIIGCGFSGATAVRFGTTPSPSISVTDDANIFAVPPTPGSGTVDITVVTPLGVSSIIP
jgi:hypothetical protein